MIDLYKMGLGERAKDEQIEMSIVRVPGGWIFIDYGAESQSQCFVPFNTEFIDGMTDTEIGFGWGRYLRYHL